MNESKRTSRILSTPYHTLTRIFPSAFSLCRPLYLLLSSLYPPSAPPPLLFIFLVRYELDTFDTKNDLKRLQNNSRYKLVTHWDQPRDAQYVSCFACVNSLHSRLILSAGSNRGINVIDAGAGRSITELPSAHTRAVHTIRFPTPSEYVSHPNDS